MPISINTPTSSLKLLPADKQFIDLVNNRITMYGQIPYTVPQDLIIEITKESARFFYKYYWRALRKGFYRLTKESIIDFTSNNSQAPGYENMRGYVVILPDYIQTVNEIYEANKNNNDIAQNVYEVARDVQGGSPQGNNIIMGINSSLYVIQMACKLVEENAFASVFGESIPFNFTPLTKELFINKGVENNLMLEVSCNVDIQYLYKDDFFLRHVIGRTKQELKRKLGGHTTPLPGDVTLNADEICNNLEDVEKVEDLIKNGSGIGDIILAR